MGVNLSGIITDILSLNFQKCLYAIFCHFDIFTYLEKWKSGLFENARAMVIIAN